MTSSEYISELKESLTGEVAPQVIQETVDYYGQYIIDEVNAGRTEEQVIEELGPARLIAKSIIDAQEGAARKEEAWQEEQKRREDRHFHADVGDDGKVDLKYGRFSLNSWYGKLIIVLAVIVLVVIIGMLLVGLFNLIWLLLPIIAVVALIAGIAYLLIHISQR